MTFILNFFKSLPDEIKYAIERGLDDIDTSSKGDLDILIKKSDFPFIVKKALAENLLISSTVTYGGARIFLGDNKGNLKRIDFDWLIHYRGIPLDSVDRYIKNRQKDTKTGVFTLQEREHAAIINYIKNSYGGAEKYRDFLKKNGYKVFNIKQRRWFILSKIVRHPLSTILGKVRYAACYLFRALYPTGLSIYGLSKQQLENNIDIMYLFQNRISSNNGLRAFLDTHFLSKLHIATKSQLADIAVNNDSDPSKATTIVIEHLSSSRIQPPSLLFRLA